MTIASRSRDPEQSVNIDPADIGISHTHRLNTRQQGAARCGGRPVPSRRTAPVRISVCAWPRVCVLRPLNMAPRAAARKCAGHKTKKATPMPPALKPAARREAERPSMLPVVLAVLVVVDAIDLPDSNHRSEAVLEHSFGAAVESVMPI